MNKGCLKQDDLEALKAVGVIGVGERLTITCESADHPVNHTGKVTSADVTKGVVLNGCTYPLGVITGVALAKPEEKDGTWFPRAKPEKAMAASAHS